MAATAPQRDQGAVAHELANALGCVLQLAHLARAAAEAGSQIAADLEALAGECQRAAGLLEELAARLPGPPTALVIEDDEVMRGLVARSLADAGLRVIEAGTAAEALAELACGPAPALVLTDLDLPGLGGAELARAFAATAAAPPVIVMSGSAPPEVPAAGVLAKPFAPADLVRTVRDVLGGADGRTG